MLVELTAMIQLHKAGLVLTIRKLLENLKVLIQVQRDLALELTQVLHGSGEECLKRLQAVAFGIQTLF